MSVNLIKCSTPRVEFKDHTKFNNSIVNISLCKAFLASSEYVYGAACRAPTIFFAGVDVTWFFSSEEERDAELERIFSLFSKGISESKKEKEITSEMFKKIAGIEI